MSYEEAVRSHYRDQARQLGLSPQSTMPDDVVRAKELEAILGTLASISNARDLKILEVGCGNGTLLERLAGVGYKDVVGVDYLPEFVELARSRNLGFRVEEADIRKLPFGDSAFDVVVSERVIINLKERSDQERSFAELRRVLRKGGCLILIEAFERSWYALNEARSEFGLPPISMPEQNRWFKEGELEDFSAGRFTEVTRIGDSQLTPRHFLSSHYFMSRVIHALLLEVRRCCPDNFQGKVRDSHFARFMGPLLPPHGEYSPVQFLCLKAT